MPHHPPVVDGLPRLTHLWLSGTYIFTYLIIVAKRIRDPVGLENRRIRNDCSERE
jgi:hypothetical protein